MTKNLPSSLEQLVFIYNNCKGMAWGIIYTLIGCLCWCKVLSQQPEHGLWKYFILEVSPAINECGVYV